MITRFIQTAANIFSPFLKHKDLDVFFEDTQAEIDEYLMDR